MRSPACSVLASILLSWPQLGPTSARQRGHRHLNFLLLLTKMEMWLVDMVTPYGISRFGRESRR
ncbi:exported hypothetical protein [Cupriavidus taiwanensis]|nr:exported hypothetical protein [Cupriavidus taiwanensis]